MSFRWAAFSKAGGRRYNEDFIDYSQREGVYLWGVADGVGGHHGGNIASKLALMAILEQFKRNPTITSENIRSYLDYANKKILEEQSKHKHLWNMQTTIVVVVSDKINTIIAHVGDSRCYFVRQGKILVQTKDHSLVQILVNQGEILEQEQRYHEDRNKVLKSLGKGQQCIPTLQHLEYPLQHGDAFLLCSDGLWEYVTETEMEVDFVKSNHPEEWITSMEKRLLARAEKNHDNYSAISIFIE